MSKPTRSQLQLQTPVTRHSLLQPFSIYRLSPNGPHTTSRPSLFSYQTYLPFPIPPVSLLTKPRLPLPPISLSQRATTTPTLHFSLTNTYPQRNTTPLDLTYCNPRTHAHMYERECPPLSPHWLTHPPLPLPLPLPLPPYPLTSSFFSLPLPPSIHHSRNPPHALASTHTHSLYSN